MVKNAMGLARRVSMNVKGRIGGKGKGTRGSQVLRRIEEDEFPYVGELSLARRETQRQRRRESQGKFAKSPQTGRRTSSLFGSPSFGAIGNSGSPILCGLRLPKANVDRLIRRQLRSLANLVELFLVLEKLHLVRRLLAKSNKKLEYLSFLPRRLQ